MNYDYKGIVNHFLNTPITPESLVNLADFVVCYAKVMRDADIEELGGMCVILDRLRVFTKNIVEFTVFQFSVMDKELTQHDPCITKMVEAGLALGNHPYIKQFDAYIEKEDIYKKDMACPLCGYTWTNTDDYHTYACANCGRWS